MKFGNVIVGFVLCVVQVDGHGVRANLMKQQQRYDEVPHNPQRSLTEETVIIGGGLTRPPSTSPSTHVKAETNYTYFLYTDGPSNQIDQVLGELNSHVQKKLENFFSDLVGDVQLTAMRDRALTEGCPSSPPASVPASYTTCAKFRTFIEATMERQWDVDIFCRTVVQVIRNHLEDYNTETSNSVFVVYNDPIEVRTQITLLLVGARQLMSISEHSFLADILHISALEKLALQNENPSLRITNVDFIWQRVVPRGAPSNSNNDQDEGNNVRGRHLQAPDLPPSSLQTELLIVATCAGVECTDDALSQFVLTTFPQVNVEFLENLKKWSQTNYFRDGGITEVVLDTEDPTPTIIDVPELPPESDYQTPGVQEKDKPLWIWFSLLIALGAVFVACVYVTFCITARDFQAARKMRQEHRQAKQKEQPVERPLPQRQQSDQDFDDERDAVPQSPARQRYFASRQVPPPEQPEDLEFDVSESENVGAEGANVSEVPHSPSPEKKKKKKKKKKKSSSSTDKGTKDDSPHKSSSKSKSSSKKKKVMEEQTTE